MQSSRLRSRLCLPVFPVFPVFPALLALLPPSLLAETLGGPSLGFTFAAPAGWRSAPQGDAILLGHETIPGAILVRAHSFATPALLLQQFQEGVQEEGLWLLPVSPPEEPTPGIYAGNFQGTAQGQPVLARISATAFPSGGGALILALANPQVFTPALAGAVEKISGTIQPAPVPSASAQSPAQAPDALIQHFAGSWRTSTRNSESGMVLRPDGSFSQSHEASYSGSFTDSGGYNTGNWGTANQGQDRGTWQVRGTREQGVLLFTTSEGTSQASYRVHRERGQTYWGEYWVDGVLWGKR